eukprot:5025568-Prymnesium_polylepis.1
MLRVSCDARWAADGRWRRAAVGRPGVHAARVARVAEVFPSCSDRGDPWTNRLRAVSEDVGCARACAGVEVCAQQRTRVCLPVDGTREACPNPKWPDAEARAEAEVCVQCGLIPGGSFGSDHGCFRSRMGDGRQRAAAHLGAHV